MICLCLFYKMRKNVGIDLVLLHRDTESRRSRQCNSNFSSQNEKPQLLKVLDGVWREDSEGQCSSQGTTAEQPEEGEEESSSSSTAS